MPQAQDGIHLALILFPFCILGGLLGSGLRIAKLTHDKASDIPKKSMIFIGTSLGLMVAMLSYGAISSEWESALRMSVIAIMVGYQNADFLADNEKLMASVLSNKMKELGLDKKKFDG